MTAAKQEVENNTQINEKLVTLSEYGVIYTSEQLSTVLALRNIFTEPVANQRSKFVPLSSITAPTHLRDVSLQIYKNVLEPYDFYTKSSFRSWWYGYNKVHYEGLCNHFSRMTRALKLIADSDLYAPKNKVQLGLVNQLLVQALQEMLSDLKWLKPKNLGELFATTNPPVELLTQTAQNSWTVKSPEVFPIFHTEYMRLLDNSKKEALMAKEKADQSDKKAQQAEEKADESDKKAQKAQEKADESDKKAQRAQEKADESDKKAQKAQEKADESDKKAQKAQAEAQQAKAAAQQTEITIDAVLKRLSHLESQQKNQTSPSTSQNATSSLVATSFFSPAMNPATVASQTTATSHTTDAAEWELITATETTSSKTPG